MTNADFANGSPTIHYPAVNHPNKVAVLIKEGDELLHPGLSKNFLINKGAMVMVQAGGDHRFSDFGNNYHDGAQAITAISPFIRV